MKSIKVRFDNKVVFEQHIVDSEIFDVTIPADRFPGIKFGDIDGFYVEGPWIGLNSEITESGVRIFSKTKVDYSDFAFADKDEFFEFDCVIKKKDCIEVKQTGNDITSISIPISSTDMKVLGLQRPFYYRYDDDDKKLYIERV